MLEAFETNTYACGGTALAAFQMITFPCWGGRGLAAFLDKHIFSWRDGIGGI